MPIHNHQNISKQLFKENNLTSKTQQNSKEKVRLKSILEATNSLQSSFRDLGDERPLVVLLKRLPTNYPIRKIYVNGIVIKTSKFIKIDEQIGLAYFLNNQALKIVDIDSIDGISF